MSASVLRIRQRTISHAKLITWCKDGPHIWFRYGDGYEFISDMRVKTPDVLSAIAMLSSGDQAKLAERLGMPYAFPRS
jgi:hypothetical protein